ncbi:hypothetical protein COBT_003626, partial [Conglomerata obtusa]
MNFVFNSINIYTKHKNNTKKVVEDACGEIAPGQVFAIVGPNGCGKTSLLRALAGRLSLKYSYNGNIQYNDQNIEELDWKQTTEFISKNYHLHEELTVKENLFYAAKFLYTFEKQKHLDRVINDLMKDFCIDHLKNFKIQKLTEDEKKKMLFALYFLIKPKILFVNLHKLYTDEETLVEDIKMLKYLASTGMSICITLNDEQKNVLSLIDKVLMLEKGKIIFSGNTTNIDDNYKINNKKEQKEINLENDNQNIIKHRIFDNNNEIKQNNESNKNKKTNAFYKTQYIDKNRSNFTNTKKTVKNIFLLYKRNIFLTRNNCKNMWQQILGRIL